MGKYEDECYKRYFDFLCEVDKRPKNINVVMSKRQLNIAKEAEKRYLGRPLHQYYSAEDLAKAFRDGAKWADEHPNLESLWHDASEEPLLEKKDIIFLHEPDIAYVTERNGGTFSFMLEDFNWERFVNLLKISKWAYISDLLPKQFGNSKQLKGE